jgi:tetratricopeptide (TPR) repeat protein
MAWAKAQAAIVLAASLLLVAGIATFVSTKNSPSYPRPTAGGEDKDVSTLQAVYSRYVKESMHPIDPQNRSNFFAFWQEEFTNVLEATKGAGLLRRRMVGELGAIQGALGEEREEMETLSNLMVLATAAGDLHDQLEAAAGQFGMSVTWEFSQSTNISFETFTNFAFTYENLLLKSVDQNDTTAARGQMCDGIDYISSSFYMLAKNQKESAHFKMLIQNATALTQKSIALGDIGVNALPVKLWYLAQCQSIQGQRDEAAETYGKLAAMKQSFYPPLWIEYLRICETTDMDSQAYRDAIEKVLNDYAKQGKTDAYENTLRHELGVSYLKAGQYEKSTEVLNGIAGKNKDNNVNAYEMLLMAQNYGQLGDKSAEKGLLQDITKQYPNTAIATEATKELQGLGPQKAHKKPVHWIVRTLIMSTLVIPPIVIISMKSRRKA